MIKFTKWDLLPIASGIIFAAIADSVVEFLVLIVGGMLIGINGYMYVYNERN